MTGFFTSGGRWEEHPPHQRVLHCTAFTFPHVPPPPSLYTPSSSPLSSRVPLLSLLLPISPSLLLPLPSFLHGPVVHWLRWVPTSIVTGAGSDAVGAAAMGRSHIPFSHPLHCHAAGASLLDRWPTGLARLPLRCCRRVGRGLSAGHGPFRLGLLALSCPLSPFMLGLLALSLLSFLLLLLLPHPLPPPPPLPPSHHNHHPTPPMHPPWHTLPHTHTLTNTHWPLDARPSYAQSRSTTYHLRL